MDKIRITEIGGEVHKIKGFDHVGCHGSSCDDACCVHGADFDSESYELVMRFGNAIEEELEVSVADCFTGEWSGEKEFLGGDSTESEVGSSGYCVFHAVKGKGCVLYKLVTEKGLPRRLIPSICRLYPLTWAGGELLIAEDTYPRCNCLHGKGTEKNLFETQRHEIEDIFDIQCAVL